MKKSSCRGLPTTVAGKIASRRRAICRDLEDRVVVLQRVVAVVVAERALGPARARRHLADERELGVGDERMRPRPPRPACSRSPAMSEASISSGTFSGSGAMADRMSAGGPPRKTVTGSAWPRAFGHLVVEAAALADLPVHARCDRASCTCRRYMPRLWPRPSGMLGVDQRQRDERAAVLGPGGQAGRRSSRTSSVDDLGDRAAPARA